MIRIKKRAMTCRYAAIKPMIWPIKKAVEAAEYEAWPRSTNPAVPAGQSIDDREKNTLSKRQCVSGAYSLHIYTHDITYKEVITNEN